MAAAKKNYEFKKLQTFFFIWLNNLKLFFTTRNLMFHLKYLFCHPFDSAAVATALQFNTDAIKQ